MPFPVTFLKPIDAAWPFGCHFFLSGFGFLFKTGMEDCSIAVH